jgi:hypothetical protein
MNFSNWRDCYEWKKEGLQMNTTSNEAAKLYDITLSQLVGWYENLQYGGVEISVKNMLKIDPNFGIMIIKAHLTQ